MCDALCPPAAASGAPCFACMNTALVSPVQPAFDLMLAKLVRQTSVRSRNLLPAPWCGVTRHARKYAHAETHIRAEAIAVGD